MVPMMQDKSYILSKTLQWLQFFRCFSSIFDIFINIHKYVNEVLKKYVLITSSRFIFGPVCNMFEGTTAATGVNRIITIDRNTRVMQETSISGTEIQKNNIKQCKIPISLLSCKCKKRLNNSLEDI